MCAQAVDGLVPLYLEFLKRQNDELDDETWTISKTAACSLEAFAKVSGDAVLTKVGSFVEQNISRLEWRLKEATMCAFCLCINQSTTKIVSILLRSFACFLNDEDPKTRRTTAWTLGLICKCLPEAIDDLVGASTCSTRSL